MKFEIPEINVVTLEIADVITTSTFNPGQGGVGGGDDM